MIFISLATRPLVSVSKGSTMKFLLGSLKTQSVCNAKSAYAIIEPEKFPTLSTFPALFPPLPVSNRLTFCLGHGERGFTNSYTFVLGAMQRKDHRLNLTKFISHLQILLAIFTRCCRFPILNLRNLFPVLLFLYG